MIAPVCDWCHTELTEFGGLLFSPPDKDGMVKKYHVGVCCLSKLLPCELADSDDKTCIECDGSGRCLICDAVDHEDCFHCGERGACPVCNGRGKVS